MTQRSRWFTIVLGWCVFLSVLMEMPQILRMLHPQYSGVLTALNADEEVYTARVEEALTGRPELAADGFTGDPLIRGTQPAVLESAIGILFSPLGLRAPVVLQILDGILPPLLFLAIIGFLGLSGFSRRQAVLGSMAFSLLELYNLNRPIHQTGSTLVVIVAMTGVLVAFRGRTWTAAAAGMLFGSLFGMTFWPWSFAWTWLCLMLLWSLCSRNMRARKDIVVAGAVGVLAAAPFLIEMFRFSHNPAWSDAVFRSGMHPGHMPESWIYSALFTIMLVGTAWTLWSDRKARVPVVNMSNPFMPATLFLAAIWIVIHQQIIHGQIFNFVSHYLMFMVIAAISVVLMACSIRRPSQILAGLAAVIYLLAVGYDGRYVLRQWDSTHIDWGMQHMADALPTLDALPRSHVLTDPETSGWLAGSTRHDVAYSVYLKNVLISHRAIAERFCLTQLPVPPALRHIADRSNLLYPDALTAFRNPEDRVREITITAQACDDLDKDPAAALARYGFTHILWNETAHPEWTLDQLKAGLTKIASGEGWSLYSV